MIDGILGFVIAAGLVLSIIGSWKAMSATPIFGADTEGYMAQAGPPVSIDDLVRRWRWAWYLLLAGFSFQFIGAAILAGLALQAG